MKQPGLFHNIKFWLVATVLLVLGFEYLKNPDLVNLMPSANYMKIIEADALGATGQNIRVAVMDSGFDPEHTDYEDNIEEVSDIFQHPGDHGTSVVSVITNVAPDCKIHFFDQDYSAFDRVLRSNVKIINMSWGFQTFTPTEIEQKMVEIVNDGKIIVVSAGNDGQAMGSTFSTERWLKLAESPEIKGRMILVGSSTGSGLGIARHSNYATDPAHPLVYAPGRNILTATTDDSHKIRSGTSFAAPQVAGFLALLMERFPGHKPEWYVSVVKQSATDTRGGCGVINGRVARALGSTNG